MRFYELDKPRVDLSEGPYMTCRSCDGSSDEVVEMCPVCGRGGFYSWRAPHRAEIEGVGRPQLWSDVILFMYGEMLISDRAKRMVEEELSPQTSMFFAASEVLKVKRVPKKIAGDRPRYWYARVHRTHTAVDLVRSGVVLRAGNEHRPCCGSGPKRMARLCIDESTWGGEDIFRPRNLALEVVTQRFVDAYQRAGLTGLVFRENEEAAFDFYRENNDPATDVLPPG